ncbi:SPOR domain-containing protein [Zoogloea sp.]|uniref:SPOR domain-containing protein n=1 Tax=Zoogloea sp. TaxID=49181 RepID=UPI001A3D874D|nr:SPOR domain-containing protein [Zoogloea sp.]
MADNDTQVDLKKRARRRLVGSAALALAAAIVLPMVMDHEPRTPTQDVQIRIPGQEGSNFTSRVITGKGPAPSQPVAGAVAEETAPPVVDEAVRRKPESESDSPVFKPGEELIPPPRKVEQPKAEARAEALPKPDPKLEAAKLKEKEREREKEKEREKAQAEAARAKALLAGVTPKAGGPDSPHVVSLGAYREAGNVSILRAKLKAEGYPSYTESLGDKVRVRAGPFPNKAAADKAATRISKILGVPASVVAKP